MADNIAGRDGAGNPYTAAARDDGAAKHQRVQPTLGGADVDDTHPVPVKQVPVAPNNLRVVTVTAGTRVPLNGSTLRIRRGVVVALASNGGVVTVGGPGVVAATGARNGPDMIAGDAFDLGAVDLAATYIDSTVGGEGVAVYYEV